MNATGRRAADPSAIHHNTWSTSNNVAGATLPRQAAELNLWHGLPLQVAARRVPELRGLAPAPSAPGPFSLADLRVAVAVYQAADVIRLPSAAWRVTATRS